MRAGLLSRVIRIGLQRYRNWTFEFQATLVAAAVLIGGMAAIGGLVGKRLEEGIMQSAASETVLNMDNFIKPLVQDIAHQMTLPKAAQEALTAVLLGRTLGRNVAAIKIWSPSGTIVYSNRPEIIGRTYPMFRNLQQAFDGRVIAEFDDLTDDENEFERSLGEALLEIYAPLRETSTNRIIAVAEFYEIRDSLRIQLRNVRLQTWAVIGSLTIAMIAALSGIMVKHKRQALEKRVAELSRLLAENQELQSRIRNAHHRMTEINEMFLRRVSAELHDAPAQLIGFALLRLDALRPLQDLRADPLLQQDYGRANGGRDEVEIIRNALAESLNEIRNISAGLAPPELVDVSLSEALELAAFRHAERTGAEVDCRIERLPERVDPSLKMSLYRFAQEGLNNAFRHAGGRGQALHARCDDGLLEVTISDDGTDRTESSQRTGSAGLGLAGLRGRIESIGGAFDFHSQPGSGARLTARFNLAKVELINA